MTTPNAPETPSQLLARQIVERLIKEGLIGAKEAGALQPKLAEGKLRGEDWRLPIELGGDTGASQ